MIRIKLNGKEEEIESNISISDLLKKQKIKLEGVFIGYNQSIVRQTQLNEIILKNGDALEIIRITAGG
ncbi:MAG: sulfur carrier protein ThiS [Elusimicrobiota bacterium]|jgi:thiamine biosynthesis protein ThiS|nr:sulfur carrier protein ThiS [Elusimicrobiota bacterium]